MLKFDQLITSFTISLVHVFTVIYLNFENIRRKKIVYLKLLAITFAIVFIANTFAQKPYIRLPILFFLLPLCILYLYNLSIAESFYLSIISDLLILFGEWGTRIFLYPLSKSNHLIYISFRYEAILNFSFLIFMFMTIVIANFLKGKVHIKKWSAKNNIYYITLVCFITIINTLLFRPNSTIDRIYLVNFCYKICVFLLFVYIISLNIKIQFEQQRREYKQLTKYTQAIEEMNENLISLKHDFSNILFSINGYIVDNRISELKKFLNTHVLKEYFTNMDNLILPFLKHIKNSALKGILFSKLNHADKKNINLFINIFTDIEINNIVPTDLIRIIGILLDNAIEASENSAQKELHLGMEADKTHVSILIGNTYHDLPDIQLIFKRGYSTKGKNRGLGLYNLKKILSLYPHAHLKTSIHDNIFFQELIVMK